MLRRHRQMEQAIAWLIRYNADGDIWERRRSQAPVFSSFLLKKHPNIAQVTLHPLFCKALLCLRGELKQITRQGKPGTVFRTYASEYILRGCLTLPVPHA